MGALRDKFWARWCSCSELMVLVLLGAGGFPAEKAVPPSAGSMLRAQQPCGAVQRTTLPAAYQAPSIRLGLQ
jgi:hypothetical protein